MNVKKANSRVYAKWDVIEHRKGRLVWFDVVETEEYR